MATDVKAIARSDIYREGGSSSEDVGGGGGDAKGARESFTISLF